MNGKAKELNYCKLPIFYLKKYIGDIYVLHKWREYIFSSINQIP